MTLFYLSLIFYLFFIFNLRLGLCPYILYNIAWAFLKYFIRILKNVPWNNSMKSHTLYIDTSL